jgi:exonuclease SbcC
MAGIGAFPNEVTIDFEHLDATGLYLVVGPTGAGKTTIFEAMSYALFAQVPSRRDVKSTFPHKRSFIEFTFTHNGADHRVFRDITGAAGDYYERLPKGRRVAQRKAVTAHVEDLLKLTADQFMKIILLPQGQFQEFLVAKTSDKEEILQRIFGTEIYDAVAERVATLANELANEFNMLELKIKTESHTTASEVLDVRNLYPDLGLPDDTSDFARAKKAVKSKIPGLELASKAAADRMHELSGDLARAKDLKQIYLDSQRLKELRDDARAEASLVKEATESIESHKRAERALRQRDDYDRAASALEETESLRKEVLRDVRRESTRLRINIPQVRAFRGALESSRNLPEDYGVLSRAVTAALKALDDDATLKDELDDARTRSNELIGDIKNLTAAIALLENKKAQLGVKRSSTNSQVSKHAELQRKVDALDRQLESADVENATRRLTIATNLLNRANMALAKTEKVLLKSRAAHEYHLAGQLAKHLKDDERCPVCGSTDHPKPAPVTRRIDLQASIDRHAEARATVADAQREVREAEKALASAETARAKLPTTAAQRKLREQYKQAQIAAKARDGIESNYEKLTDKLSTAKEHIATCSAELRSTKTAINRVSAAIERAKADLPSHLSDVQRRETKQALDKLSGLVRRKHTLDQKCDNETTQVSTLDRAVKKALQKEGFRSLEQAVDAQLKDKELREKNHLVAQAKERDDKIIGLAARVDGKKIPKELPDIRALERDLSTQRDTQTAAVTKLEKVKSLRDRIGKLERVLAELRPKAEFAEECLTEARQLEKAMNTGQGVGAHRVYRLQEWVQRRLFEQVCRVASKQLHELTAGRYSITLTPDADSAVKHAQGLDLYVLDSFNGKKRGVGSLSGGETFLASLALALALAEVVQSHAGGIKIPSLFIDEGFGSLDRETLENAMDALLKLQNSGRTVGVITHVETMQDQLPIGIRVIKSDEGSKLEFPLLQ